jgi:hypothetical protein
MEARSQPHASTQDLGHRPAPPPDAPFATPEDARSAAPDEEVRMIMILFIAHLRRPPRVLSYPFRGICSSRNAFSTDKLFYVNKGGGQKKIYQKTPRGICCFRDASSIHREDICTRYRTHTCSHTRQKKTGDAVDSGERQRPSTGGREDGGEGSWKSDCVEGQTRMEAVTDVRGLDLAICKCSKRQVCQCRQVPFAS